MKCLFFTLKLYRSIVKNKRLRIHFLLKGKNKETSITPCCSVYFTAISGCGNTDQGDGEIKNGEQEIKCSANYCPVI